MDFSILIIGTSFHSNFRSVDTLVPAVLSLSLFSLLSKRFRAHISLHPLTHPHTAAHLKEQLGMLHITLTQSALTALITLCFFGICLIVLIRYLLGWNALSQSGLGITRLFTSSQEQENRCQQKVVAKIKFRELNNKNTIAFYTCSFLNVSTHARPNSCNSSVLLLLTLGVIPDQGPIWPA